MSLSWLLWRRPSTTPKKFENAAFFLVFGLLTSTLIRHENRALRKRSWNPRNLTEFLACTVTQWKNKSKTIKWKLWCFTRLIKMTLVQVLSQCVFLNFRYSSKHFAQIHRVQCGAAMLVYLRGTPTWGPGNSLNIRAGLFESRLTLTQD